MSRDRSWTQSFFTGIWTLLNFFRNLVFNIVFLGIVGFIVYALMSGEEQISVPKNSALVMNLYGDVVIQKQTVDPFDEFMREAFDQREENPEVLLRDVLWTIENAKQDNRIKAMVLDLHGLGNAGMDKLKQIAMAIEDFKQADKPVYAIGDFYSQGQYYLASHADHLYLNPMGFMFLDGFGRYQAYFKSALEKLKAKTHVFRVGTFKSAVEPVLRDDMSEEAKQANEAWLNSLWSQYKQDIAQARGFTVENFDEQINDFMLKFENAGGDFAQYALQNNWVDALKTREEVRLELVELVGKDSSKKGFSNIDFEKYLQVVKPLPLLKNDTDKVGIVVAKGTILNGNQKAGTIGGDSTARLLRQARLDDNIKAVVLQVDSPGGSAFASEIIRQEVKLLQEAGKPVVASMSSMAASGGYWISANADEIWAAPSTITGSIGIFGMFLTYEDTLGWLGIHTDGVGTTEFSGAFSPARTLNPAIGNIFQRSIEHGYEQFIELVSTARDMPVERVDEIAQGRVWIGETAKSLGLVDNLGYLNDAVQSAANLASMERYDIQYVERPLSASEQFWKEFFGGASALVGKAITVDSDHRLMNMVQQLVSDYDKLGSLNDPRGMYALCFMCEY
ncbi:signal peptide peptidase SppA [Planctobacterium marinum]|uniref:signal peptide peptidase SppA n=1 Tax=Planctobacterium marinum TaxID=1631968 RepID=UPI001E4DDF85|nr:signal peptide peptidase SppA [Planctobacterium marinum]MCC2607296.1 signal peptide peptidase SppA [Planctobacterium marinum]